MLGPLIGNRSKEGVLLFLFVNEQGYAHEISLALGLTLSRVQNALSSLAEGGVVVFLTAKRDLFSEITGRRFY
jgi:predicted transcriptional regulator